MLTVNSTLGSSKDWLLTKNCMSACRSATIRMSGADPAGEEDEPSGQNPMGSAPVTTQPVSASVITSMVRASVFLTTIGRSYCFLSGN
jgi:hypothetical protein